MGSVEAFIRLRLGHRDGSGPLVIDTEQKRLQSAFFVSFTVMADDWLTCSADSGDEGCLSLACVVLPAPKSLSSLGL